MSAKDGGPAFPAAASEYGNPCGPGDVVWAHPGMTLRDHFAGLAMQGICAGSQMYYPGQLAQVAYQVADEMMKARDA